jgi:hypothetical protein
MMIMKVFDVLLAKYQIHIFIVVLYYAYMQFKINKRLEVQTAVCNGRFNLIDLKIKEAEKDIANGRKESEQINGIRRKTELFDD